SKTEFEAIMRNTVFRNPSKGKDLKSILQDLPGGIGKIAIDGGAEAITLPPVLSGTNGSTIVWAKVPPTVGPGDKLDVNMAALIGHELVHVIQQKRWPGKTTDGTAFIAEYILDNQRNIKKGMDGKAAYENIHFEVIAYAFQEAMQNVLRKDEFRKMF